MFYFFIVIYYNIWYKIPIISYILKAEFNKKHYKKAEFVNSKILLKY